MPGLNPCLRCGELPYLVDLDAEGETMAYVCPDGCDPPDACYTERQARLHWDYSHPVRDTNRCAAPTEPCPAPAEAIQTIPAAPPMPSLGPVAGGFETTTRDAQTESD